MVKRFVLSKDQIKPLAEGYGHCIATDRITVDGCPVRFMYREAPDNDVDSGWRFDMLNTERQLQLQALNLTSASPYADGSFAEIRWHEIIERAGH